MRAYLIKRLLLMIPTLFGVSLVVWIVVTAAPGDPGLAPTGQEQAKQGRRSSESRRIFRTQFNLDKPLFFNDYPSLTTDEVLEEVRTAADFSLPPSERGRADQRLDDWGTYAVPGLVEGLDRAGTPGLQAAILRRLPVNARRIAVTRMGRPLTEEQIALNREILAETREIEDRLTPDFGTATWGDLAALEPGATDPASVALLREIEEKASRWREWLAAHRDRWEWSTAERWRIRLLDTRFGKYWSNLIRFDLGDSHVHRVPVLDLIISRLPISIVLSVLSLFFAYLISVPLGVWAAVRHGTKREQAMSTFLFMLYSLPNFFVATLLLRYLGIGRPWRVIPVTGFESSDTFHMTTWEHILDILYHGVAPLFCLTYVSLAALSRYAKSGVLNVIRADYIRTARAKGLPERTVIIKHAVRNGIIPIVTLLGTTLPAIVGGSIIIESVFTIPGIGHLLWDSINQRDYNVVIGEALIVGVLTMVGILVSDLLYAVVDPRIRYR
jgi:peptide/nickel transport system permease protein